MHFNLAFLIHVLPPRGGPGAFKFVQVSCSVVIDVEMSDNLRILDIHGAKTHENQTLLARLPQ